MRFRFDVEYVDGSVEQATVGTADQVAFELKFDRPISSLADEFRLSDACWLAWHALHRAGLPDSFEDWLAKVEDVTAGRDDIAPLETTQPTG